MHTKVLASLTLTYYALTLIFLHPLTKKSKEKFFIQELFQIMKNIHHLNEVQKMKYSMKSLTYAENGKHSVVQNNIVNGRNFFCQKVSQPKSAELLDKLDELRKDEQI